MWFPLYQAHNAVTKLSFAKFSGAQKTHGCGLVIYELFFAGLMAFNGILMLQLQ